MLKRRKLQKTSSLISMNETESIEIVVRQLGTVIDGGESEEVVRNIAYLTDGGRTTPVTVELVNGYSVTTTRRNIAQFNTRRQHHVLCNAYCIFEARMNLFLCYRADDFAVTTVFEFKKC